MSKKVKVLIGFVFSAICLWLVLRNFHLSDLVREISRANWIWLIPAITVYVSNFYIRSCRWKIALSPVTDISAARLFPILTFGYLMNNILPARMGEFARAYAGSKETNKTVSGFLGTIIVERLSDFIGLFFIMVLSLQVFSSDKLPFKSMGLIIGGGGLFMAIAIFSYFKLQKKRESITNKWLKKIMGIIQKILEGFMALKSPLKIIQLALLSITIWSMELITTKFMSMAFNLDLSIFQVAALMVGISVGVMIPAAPGYIGTYELAGTKMLGVLGFAAKVVIPFILVLHFFHFTMTSLLGLPYLFKLGFIPKPLSEEEKNGLS